MYDAKNEWDHGLIHWVKVIKTTNKILIMNKINKCRNKKKTYYLILCIMFVSYSQG